MLIKLNGVPWESVKVPDTSNLWNDFMEVEHKLLHFHSGITLTDVLVAQDKLNYFYMEHTEPTRQLYKIGCWAVGSVMNAIIQ